MKTSHCPICDYNMSVSGNGVPYCDHLVGKYKVLYDNVRKYKVSYDNVSMSGEYMTRVLLVVEQSIVLLQFSQLVFLDEERIEKFLLLR